MMEKWVAKQENQKKLMENGWCKYGGEIGKFRNVTEKKVEKLENFKN